MARRFNFVLITASSFALVLAGCGYPRQSRFQSAFLPATPVAPPAPPPVAEPPVVEPVLFIRDNPSLLRPPLTAPVFSNRSGELVVRAGQALERGRRFYRAGNPERARQEFDAAIALMFEASEEPSVDRHAFERKFDEMVDVIHRMDLAGLGAAEEVEEARFEKAPLEDILEMTFPVDPKLKPKVREQVQATASQLPLSINDSVLGYIHYFMGRGHKTLVTGLERAGRYKPMIQRILDEEGVPQEIIHLAQAESGFLARAVSRKAATGMWQFVAFRGQEYGLKRSSYYDDRMDPEKATRAAARHLRDLFNQFGDWYLAIAAYNCGPGTVEKAVERTGYADFWELRARRVLPAETTNYVPIILAMTIMAKNAAAYGIDDIEPEEPLRYDTLEMTAPTHLQLIADLMEVPVSELVALNPALLKTIAPAGYALHVPHGTADTVMAALEMIPAERRATWRIHTVVEGETLADIGRRYGVAPASIVAATGLASAEAGVGDRLVIPAAPAKPKVTRSTRSSHARRASSSRTTASRRTSTAAKHTAKTTSKSSRTSARHTPARKAPSTVSRTASRRSHAPAGSN